MVLVAVWLSTQHFGKIVGVKHTVLPDGQVLTVKFTVFAQILGPKTEYNSSNTDSLHDRLVVMLLAAFSKECSTPGLFVMLKCTRFESDCKMSLFLDRVIAVKKWY